MAAGEATRGKSREAPMAPAINADEIEEDPPERATIFELAMTAPDEGWIVVHPWSSWRGDERSTQLLHYRGGAWTLVDDVPVPLVYDLAPAGPDELWVVGNDTTRNRKDSVIAHY